MDKQQISNSIDKNVPMAKTVEFKSPGETQSIPMSNSNNSEADCCTNGVCRVTWKPQRPHAA